MNGLTIGKVAKSAGIGIETRITSYNVCYTKLLRLVLFIILPPRINILTCSDLPEGL